LEKKEKGKNKKDEFFEIFLGGLTKVPEAFGRLWGCPLMT
jgi:hypothetical protein